MSLLQADWRDREVAMLAAQHYDTPVWGRATRLVRWRCCDGEDGDSLHTSYLITLTHSLFPVDGRTGHQPLATS